MKLPNNLMSVKLTSYSHGAGCGCKIAPAVLDTILSNTRDTLHFPSLLVGNHSNDDAAVMDLGNGTAMISTTDFFMPIVDDAFDFGRIAATNAISDVYAMGGKPLMAIAILGWPIDKIAPEEAGRVLDGAKQICEEAGIPLAGGHSIDSPEPIFGLAVSGIVNVNNIKKNNTAKEGDLLFITKPIGVGTISTAAKKGIATEKDIAAAIASMTTLNKIGETLGNYEEVHAMTDITGFGLFGHLIEMAEGSGLSAEIEFKNVKVLDGLKPYLDQYAIPAITYRNWNSYGEKINEVGVDALHIGCDPQTSGGLLIAIQPSFEKKLLEIFRQFNISPDQFKCVGQMNAKGEKVVEVKEG
jgi:selenide,water dikinase